MANTNALPVTVYSKDNCVQCDATKRWLDSRAIPYISHDVTQNEQAYAVATGLGYQQVPVVVIPLDAPNGPGEHWSGFRPDMLSLLT